MAAKRSCYDILGVPPQASEQALREAHRARHAALGAQHSAEANSERQLLDMALETLVNPVSRARYDARLGDHGVTPLGGGEAVLTHERMHLAGSASAPLLKRLMAWAAVLLLLLLLAWMALPKPKLKPKAAPLAQASAPTPVLVPPLADAAPRSGALSAAEIFARNRNSIVVIRGRMGEQAQVQGSGVVIEPDAVVTNCHVVIAADSLAVWFQGRELSASLHYRDPGRDLCQLRVDGLSATPARLGGVESLMVGARVYALGAPQGLDMTLSEGLVSALRGYFDSTLIQTSAAISPGSSGGGLFDEQGRLVGITTFQAMRGQNLNFAVPVDWIKQLALRDGNQDNFPDPAGFH